MATTRPTRPTLTTWAEHLAERNPGHRFEIIGGVLMVTPLPDSAHAAVLTAVTAAYLRAGIDDSDGVVLQRVAVRLPTGPEDYAVPDLSIVDADVDAHAVTDDRYAPACFRMVLEVTSDNPGLDLRHKVPAYAVASIPVYVIVDRENERIHVLTGPSGDGYSIHRRYSPGEAAVLPGSVGAEVTLEAAETLAAGRPKKSD
ncbi:Uma2 family endonuclease [Streptomyces hilarionis]|uniref:Uma2 family endonuclease n=1 Tax=Streptomyces hilarionis TaxID=2839954 RepID=UPI00211A029A|nr:Uma2 family endonuclease [Streptomyces hilarionis]MCQ9132741.1 Uma2 family endonuclease [Streptomyces hilarionis]